MTLEVDTVKQELAQRSSMLLQESDQYESSIADLEVSMTARVDRVEATINARLEQATLDKEDLVATYERQLREASETHQAAMNSFKAQSSEVLQRSQESAQEELEEVQRVLEESHAIALRNTRERLFAEQVAELDKFAMQARESSQRSAADFEAGLAQLHNVCSPTIDCVQRC